MKKLKPQVRNSVLIPKAASLIAIITGCFVLFGLVFDIQSFKSILPDFGNMKFNTAICFVLAGITLYLIDEAPATRQPRKTIIFIFSWIVLLTGLLSLSQYFIKWNLGIGDLLLGEKPGGFAHFFSVRMGLIVSFNFTLLGIVFLLLGQRKYNWLIQALLIAMIPGAFLVIMNHVFGISFLKSIPLSAPTSMHTALLFIVLSVGVFFSPALGFLQFSFVKKIAGFLILILLIRSVIFFAINKNNQQAAEADKRGEHTHEVVMLAEQVNFRTNEIQSGAMEYIITGKENYSSLMSPLTGTINLIMGRLSELTKNNAIQQQSIDTLGNYLKSYISFQNDLVTIRRNEGFASAQKNMVDDQGKLLLSKIHSVVTEIEQEENKNFAVLKAENEQSIQNSSKLFALFQVIAFLLFLLAFWLVYKNSKFRNKVEKDLRNSLKDVADYRYAVDESSILVITDKDGIIRQVNDNFCKITQYTREELLGQDHRIINAGYHTKEFIRDLWITINNGEVWKGEIKNKAKDGSFFWLDTTIVPFMDEHGKPYQYVAIRSDITQRKELEEEKSEFNRDLQKRVEEKTKEIIEKEQQYRFLLQNMREGIMIIGYDWQYLFVNNSAVEQSKYSKQELLGHTMMEKYPGIEHTEMFQVLQSCMNTRLPELIENEFTFPDGTIRWFEMSIQPVKEGLFILSMDITERKNSRKALIESENFLRTIVETEPECVKLLSINGELQDMNQAGLAMIEADNLQQVKGKSVINIIDGPYKEAYKKLISNVFIGISGKMEFEITGLKGTQRWLETNAVPLKNNDGEIVSLLGVTRDVTERKKAEEKLQESFERYEMVNKATQDTIWEWDINANEVTRNNIFTNLYGYTKDEIKNNHDWIIGNIHPDDKEKIVTNIKNCLENSLEYWQDEYRLRAADGSYKNVYDRAFVLFDENGKPCRMIGAMTDLTDKKILEKELAEQRLKQQKLIMEVAIQSQEKEKNELGKELHDNINQILATVKIYLGMIKSGTDLPDEDLVGKSHEYVNIAMEELRKLSHSLVAPSLGDIKLEEALLELVEDTKLFNKLHVELSVDENYKKQEIDKNLELMFYRIVQEQFNNIIKYANATNVSINLTMDDCNLFLSISDNGIGFDVSQKIKGIGLKNINNRVVYYSGNMNIISAPGKGCTLEVAIPMCPVL
jgi:two-component system sensor histidine kinase UhpB